MAFNAIQTEARYFLERDIELREQLRQKLEKQAALAHEQRRIAAHVGIDDQALVQRIHALGI